MSMQKEVLYMALQYKVDILPMLNERGYSSYRLRKENLLSQGVMQSIRAKKPISWANIEQICRLLHCQPGDLIEYVDDWKGPGY